MTTAADDNYGRYRAWYAWVLRHTRWLQPFLLWCGHYILWLLALYAAAVLAVDLAGRPDILTWAETGAWGVMMILVVVSMTYHQAKLCERCAGSTPLDPQAAVEKWKPALRLNHRNTLIPVILIANIAWQAAIGDLVVGGVHAWGLPRHHDIWAYLLQDIPALIILGGFFVIDWIHRNLYPWCPWCHWGGEGDAEIVPDPDPELSKTG